VGYIVIVTMRKVTQMQNDINNTTINLDYLTELKNIKDALQLLADLDEKSLELFGLSKAVNFGVDYTCKIHTLIETYKVRFEQILHRLRDIEHENGTEMFCLETGELVTEKHTTYKERMIDKISDYLDDAKLNKQELFCGYYLKDIDEVLDANSN